MIVYMTHPNHGTHIAYDTSEIERCKANGWSVRDEVKPVAAVVVAAPILKAAPEAPAAVVAPAKNKGGRPRKSK